MFRFKSLTNVFFRTKAPKSKQSKDYKDPFVHQPTYPSEDGLYKPHQSRSKAQEPNIRCKPLRALETFNHVRYKNSSESFSDDVGCKNGSAMPDLIPLPGRQDKLVITYKDSWDIKNRNRGPPF